MQGWGDKLLGLVSLVLESDCSLCDRSTSAVLCRDCMRQVQRCRLNTAVSYQEALPVVAWGQYGGALKRAIASLKYNNRPRLARPLGHWLADAWLSSEFAAHRLTVVPIPMHPSKQRQRGYNQAELLASAFCERTRLPLQRHGLARVRTTDALYGLSPEARSQTLAGAFQLGSDDLTRLSNRSVLLLDDIFTTGATVRSAVQTLQERQIPVFGVATVARAELFQQVRKL